MTAYNTITGNNVLNGKKQLKRIVLHIPSAETNGKYVLEHHFADPTFNEIGSHSPEKYEFEAADRPEVFRHLSKSIGIDESSKEPT